MPLSVLCLLDVDRYEEESIPQDEEVSHTVQSEVLYQQQKSIGILFYLTG